jgi:hypothetical protein
MICRDGESPGDVRRRIDGDVEIVDFEIHALRAQVFIVRYFNCD